MTTQPTLYLSALGASALLMVGCSIPELPDVNLTTDEPIKVDINVKLDVYQHTGKEGDKEKTEDAVAESEIYKRKRARMEEVQTLKNNRIAGENHRGLLTIRKLPLGEYGKYVKKAVEDENYDRTILMRLQAKQKNILFHELQEEQWKKNVAAAFVGEWIETAGEKDGSFKWIQKKS